MDRDWLEQVFDWKRRYGKVNEHNAWIPRDHWLEDWAKRSIVAYYLDRPEDSYRQVSYMIMDEDIMAASPSSVYRVLSQAAVLRRWALKETTKGNGFMQPLRPHAPGNINVSDLSISRAFYCLCSPFNGHSRYIVHQEIREQMTEQDVAIIVQRALETFPKCQPRIISDNGPQFIANDLKFWVFSRIRGFDS